MGRNMRTGSLQRAAARLRRAAAPLHERGRRLGGRIRHGRRRRAGAAGFTLIELIVVVAIIGILVTVAMPIYKDSVKKAREAVLREDLWVLRDAIDQHFTDKGHYPADLGALVEAGYI